MSWRALHTLVLVLGALSLVGGKCGGGDGSGGSPSVREIGDPVIVVPPPASLMFAAPNPSCAAVSSPFPPGFDFVPGNPDLAWVADFSPPTLIPFRVDGPAPRIAASPPPFVLPFDSDGDGREESALAPILDDIAIVATDLALVTASGYEEVIFFSPDTGTLRSFAVSVPSSFAPSDNPLLPAPGSSQMRTGLSTFACVRPPPGALDSRGNPVANVLRPAAYCDPAQPSYLASFTSGAAIVAGRLFVSTSNLGGGAGSSDTQYLPGSVLVYDIDPGALPPSVSPNETAPVIITDSFNPTQVTGYSAGGRDFVLVTASGAIGITQDDPETSAIEAGGVALSEASIDVIDAQSLELVATIPLGLAALAGGPLAIDASGRVAATGSVAARVVYAVDLSVLASLPSSTPAPIRLDGSDGANAVIFDATAPFDIPALPSGGAPPESCPGATDGSAFNHAGDLLYVSDACDGTLTVIGVDRWGAPPAPLPTSRFAVLESTPIAAPLRADTLGEPRVPGRVGVRPGVPGSDFTGRDFFYLIGQPEGSLCAIGIESS